MAIHPIEFRYGTPEMRAIWTEENRFACIVRAEMALVRAAADFGLPGRFSTRSTGASCLFRPPKAIF